MRVSRQWSLTLVVAGLVLAGCSESASESGAPASTGQAAVTSDAVVAKPEKGPSEPGIVTTDASGLEEPRVEATAPGSGADEMSATEITSLLFGTSVDITASATQARREDEGRERERIIGECMAAQGFDYLPAPVADIEVIQPPDEGIDPTSREHAEKYGFGAGGAIIVVGYGADPNAEYVASLSPSARDAYGVALRGDLPDIDAPEDADPQAVRDMYPELATPQGCEGEAFRQLTSGRVDLVRRELVDELDELNERVDADRRIVNAKAAWVGCMAGKGHAYRTIDAMYDDIDERRSPSPREGAGDGSDPEIGGGEIDAEAGLDSNDGPALSLVLVEADAYESNVAVDNWDCGGTTQFLLFNEVLAEHRDKFIAENLDAIRAGLADS